MSCVQARRRPHLRDVPPRNLELQPMENGFSNRERTVIPHSVCRRTWSVRTFFLVEPRMTIQAKGGSSVCNPPCGFGRKLLGLPKICCVAFAPCLENMAPLKLLLVAATAGMASAFAPLGVSGRQSLQLHESFGLGLGEDTYENQPDLLKGEAEYKQYVNRISEDNMLNRKVRSYHRSICVARRNFRGVSHTQFISAVQRHPTCTRAGSTPSHY